MQTENICGCLIGGFLWIYFLVKTEQGPQREQITARMPRQRLPELR